MTELAGSIGRTASGALGTPRETTSAGSTDAVARLRHTRRVLIVSALVQALALGGAVGLTIVAGSVLIDGAWALPRGIREAIVPTAGIAAAIVAGVIIWRHRFTRSARHVARWIEEREPRLEFALLTALDAATPEASHSRIEAAVRRVQWEPLVRRRVRRALVAPLAAVGILVALLLLAPSTSRARVMAPAPGDALAAGASRGAADVDPLAPIVVEVAPPAYSRLPAITLEDPATIAALTGSRVTLRGRLGSSAIEAVVGDSLLTVGSRAERWEATFVMPVRAVAVRLRHRGAERLVVLEPRADSVPVVVLSRPAADTVFAAPSGVLDLLAELRDDIGIAAGGVEYIVSSGSGESFSFRSGTLSPVAGVGRTRIPLAMRLVIDSLAIAPGDIVHLRAFARDANVVTGPSIGYSETRALRVARPDEQDSVAVDGAPPPEADASLLSQRMLIILTEELERRRTRMTRPNLVAESRRIAADQKRLRRTVGDIIFTRLGTEPDAEHVHGPGDVHEAGDMTPSELLRAAERANRAGSAGQALDFHGDESPVVAINRPLLEAYNHMWDASRELDVGEPARALPPMRAALAAIQRARQAERIYLRGRVAPVIVDVAAVRLQGKDPGSGSGRTARTPLEHRREADRFGRAVELLARTPQQGIDSLLLLRMDLLTSRPAAAATLGESIDLLRAGRDATAALGRARRAIAGEAVARPGLGRWSGGW